MLKPHKYHTIRLGKLPGTSRIGDAAYAGFVKALHDNPYYTGFEMLLPPAQ